jgi:hypothetical protein
MINFNRNPISFSEILVMRQQLQQKTCIGRYNQQTEGIHFCLHPTHNIIDFTS